MTGDAGRLAGGGLVQAEPSVPEPGASGPAAGQLTATGACLPGPRHDHAQPLAETGGCATAAGTAGTCPALPGQEPGDGDDLGLFGPDRPEPDDIRAAEAAAASAWANGEAEWPPSDPQARCGLRNMVSEMAEEIGWRPDEMVQVRAGDLDNALLVAVCALYEVERRMEAAQRPAAQADPDQDGRGIRWLGPGQVCSVGTERPGSALPLPARSGRSAERGDLEAG